MTTTPIKFQDLPEPTYKYSEIFHSLQGEAHYTGVPTLWVRWFLCNLECRGFGQPNPADPTTYREVGNDMSLEGVERIQDLPVFEYGCDSAYSVSKRYRHVIPEGTAPQIVDRLAALMTSPHNPQGLFLHPHSRQVTHLCFTGGEPMLTRSQHGTMNVIREFRRRHNFPTHVTIETNGTWVLTPDLEHFLATYYTTPGTEWFWSVSPKLLNTSGEPAKRTIKPQVVAAYQKASNHGVLKFVVSNSPAAWDELEQRVQDFRTQGVDWPVWVMPVGATEEAQRDDDTRAIVAETIARGYNVSARLQAYIWGNTVGV